MKVWILPAYTGIESMQPGDLPDPAPAAGEIVLETIFAALNPADRYLAVSQYPGKVTFPHVLGRDGVGRVIAVGVGIKGVRVGEMRLIIRSDVGVTRWGTLAQRVAVDARYTVPVPKGWTLEQAAGAPLVYLTAWQALTQWGKVAPDAVVMVTGASGGVGVATVQLARGMGWRVIGTSRSKDKAAQLRAMGVEFMVNAEQSGWRDEIKTYLGKKRVDLAIDNIGGEGFNGLLDLMAVWGKISVVGRLAGPVQDFNTAALFFRRLRIGGTAVGTYSNEESLAAWKRVLKVLAKAGAKPLVDHIFAFDQVQDAFKRLAAGPMGKVVVSIQKA